MSFGRSCEVTKHGVNVFADTRLSGRLERSDVTEDTTLFTYRQGCPPDAAVSLTMPVRADQYDAMSGLLPIFDMNLPEGALRERLRSQFAKAIAGFDDLDLLSIVGTSQIGRLRYSHEEEITSEVPSQDLHEILTHRGTTDLFSHLLERYAAHSGISGAQPKVLLRASEAPGKITHRGATHIVKAFDPAEYPELAANELICTRGAAAAGIVTARIRMSHDRRLLVVDRFDLGAGGSYLGMEDFCVLDGRRSHGRYDGSYENIARRIAAFVSPAALDHAREQYSLMVAYACAIENGDAHLKNFAVLYDHPLGEVRLAPGYDILSTTPYLPRDTLALTLDGSKRFPVRAQLLAFIRQVTGCGPRRSAALLAQVEQGVTVALQEAGAYGKEHSRAREFAQRLTGAMRRGLARLTEGS
jgi:serine/threonine-protein kinase HipA